MLAATDNWGKDIERDILCFRTSSSGDKLGCIRHTEKELGGKIETKTLNADSSFFVYLSGTQNEKSEEGLQMI